MGVRRRYITLAVFAASVGIALPLVASGAPSAAGAPSGGASSLAPTIIQVSQDFNYLNGGEPEVGVNPLHPNNIIYVTTRLGLTPSCELSGNPNCQLQNSPFGPMPAGNLNDVTNFPTDRGFSPNGMWVTKDGGKHWKDVAPPEIQPPQSNPDAGTLLQGDPAIAFGPDGTAYYLADVTHFSPTGFVAPAAGIETSVSHDGGEHWSTPVLSYTQGDRPFMIVDQTNGRVYVMSGANFLGHDSTTDPNAGGQPGSTTPNSGDLVGTGPKYLVMSNDGVHWGPYQNGCSTEGPSCGPPSPAPFTAHAYPVPNGSGGIAANTSTAAFGVFATVGPSTSSSACAPVSAPCVIFETTNSTPTSWNGWVQHPIPNSGNSSGSVLVTADPTTAGHYVVAYLNSTGTGLNVQQTHDYGATWSSPTLVSENTTKIHFRPWISFGPDGTLAMSWRTSSSGRGFTSPYDAWMAVSRDGGSTFSSPREVSGGLSPTPYMVTPGGGGLGDDVGWVTIGTDGNAYVAWADWRVTAPDGNPSRQGFLSVIPLAAFST